MLLLLAAAGHAADAPGRLWVRLVDEAWEIFAMSVAQLQDELSKLTAQEKLALADYLVRQAESSSELSTAQLAELDRRFRS